MIMTTKTGIPIPTQRAFDWLLGILTVSAIIVAVVQICRAI